MAAYTLATLCIGAVLGWFLFRQERLPREIVAESTHSYSVGLMNGNAEGKCIGRQIGIAEGKCIGFAEGWKKCYAEEVPVRLSNGRFSKPGST